ncbi:hypothetical protein A2U01_0054500, partial [Trifolium medium]|nr:hypothetical protein [Trifolium medium]
VASPSENHRFDEKYEAVSGGGIQR